MLQLYLFDMKKLVNGFQLYHEKSSKRQPQQNSVQVSNTPNSAIDQHLKSLYLSRLGQSSLKTSQIQILLLSKDKKIVKSSHYYHEICMRPIDATLDQISLMLSYGNYSIQVSVLMTQLDQQLFFNEEISSGSFASVYEVRVKKRIYAIKGINATVDVFNSFKHIYQEYFICYIASALGVGPKVEPLFGYDIVFFKNKVFFAMEKCSPITFYSQSLAEQFRQNLRILHSIRLVHLDLKPSNIGFSQISSKPVFLDFGFSRFIEEEVGYKTKTHFYGTKKYCSPEMKRLYYLSIKQDVDMYYNDLHCLIQSFSSIKEETYIKMEDTSEAQNSYSYEIQKVCFLQSQLSDRSLIAVLNFKHSLFTKDYEKMVQLSQKNEILSKIFYFLLKDVKNLSNKFLQLVNKLKKQLGRKPICKYSQLEKLFIQKALASNFGTLIPVTMTVSFILQLEQGKFKQVMEDVQHVYRIFILFDPLTRIFDERSNPQNLEFICNMRMNIIEKVYLLTQNKKQAIFYKKVRKVIQYFYNRLKKVADRNLIYSFRMLFLLICDCSEFPQVNYELCKLTKDPILRILTIMQVILIQILRKREYNKEEICMLLSDIPPFEIKQYEFFNKIPFELLKSSKEGLHVVLSQLIRQFDNQERQFQLTQERLLSLNNVKWCFYRSVQKNLYQQWLKNNAESVSQKIYHCLIYENLCYSDKHFSDIRSIFSSIRITKNDLLILRDARNLLGQIIQSTLETKQKLNFCGLFPKQIICDSKLLPFFIESYFSLLPNEADDRSRMKQFFKFVQQMFHLFFPLCYSLSDASYLNSIEIVSKKFKAYFCFFKEDIWYQTISVTLDGIYLMLTEANIKQINRVVGEIVDMLKACLKEPNQNEWLLNTAVFYFFLLQKYLILQESSHLQALFVSLTNLAVSNQIYRILDSDQKFFSIIIQIMNKNKNYFDSVQLILSYINRCKGDQNISLFSHRILSPPLVYAIQALASSLINREESVQIFYNLQAKDRLNVSGEYAYFQFSIFMIILHSLQKDQILRELVRITTCLERMHFLLVKEVKAKFYKIWVRYQFYRSKRKLRSILRVEKSIERKYNYFPKRAGKSQYQKIARTLIRVKMENIKNFL